MRTMRSEMVGREESGVFFKTKKAIRDKQKAMSIKPFLLANKIPSATARAKIADLEKVAARPIKVRTDGKMYLIFPLFDPKNIIKPKTKKAAATFGWGNVP